MTPRGGWGEDNQLTSWYTRAALPPHSHPEHWPQSHQHPSSLPAPLQSSAHTCLPPGPSPPPPPPGPQSSAHLLGVTLNDHPVSATTCEPWAGRAPRHRCRECVLKKWKNCWVLRTALTQDPLILLSRPVAPAFQLRTRCEDGGAREGVRHFPVPRTGWRPRASGRCQNRDPRGCSTSIHSCISAALAPA